MDDLSVGAIQKNCPHCDFNSYAYNYLLSETPNFHIVCDVHPLESGHILIIPKSHISCIGEYSPALFEEFQGLYKKVSRFIEKEYGPIATFEHGIFAQSVFHSHVQLLPFKGSLKDIIPEGVGECVPLQELSGLRAEYQKHKGYLFFSISKKMWTVDTTLPQPGFFRYRFAEAIAHPELGNWKDMHQNPKMMAVADRENRGVQTAWRKFQE